MSFISTLFFFFFIALFTTTTHATDHIVGDNKGWNPGINYTIWVKTHTFIKGDLISFRYQKGQHNVYQVNQTGYDNCTLDSAVGNWSSGKDFVELKETKRYYFICGNGFCYGGMKVSVLVHDLPPPPSASESPVKSGGERIFRRGFERLLVVLGLCVVWGIWIWGGSGLI